jgi:hypothetical protein
MTMNPNFVILKRQHGVAVFAMCRECRHSMVRGLDDDPISAEQYLLGKFTAHNSVVQDFRPPASIIK